MIAVTVGTTSWRKIGHESELLPGEVVYSGVIQPHPIGNGYDGMAWDTDNIHPKNTIEILEDYRKNKIKELRFEGLKRANDVYKDDVFNCIGEIKLLGDIDDTYTRAGGLVTRLASVKQILIAFEAARDVINGLDQVGVEAYDVATDPGWPA